ncbi:MAG: Nitrile hydratase beta subunit, partial [uncultured Acetobacteraceae bacterium]
ERARPHPRHPRHGRRPALPLHAGGARRGTAGRVRPPRGRAAPTPRAEEADDGGRAAARHREHPGGRVPGPHLLRALAPFDHHADAGEGRRLAGGAAM